MPKMRLAIILPNKAIKICQKTFIVKNEQPFITIKDKKIIKYKYRKLQHRKLWK
jgi:hypothetical protein